MRAHRAGRKLAAMPSAVDHAFNPRERTMSASSSPPIHSLRRRAAIPRPSRVCRGRGMTPLGAVARGLVAGAIGTVAMDSLLFARYRRGGRQYFEPWEFSSGLASWENAPAPALVGKRLVEGLFERELPPRHAGWSTTSRTGPTGSSAARSTALSRDRCAPHVSDTACRSAPACGRPATSSCPPRSCTSRSGNTTARPWRRI